MVYSTATYQTASANMVTSYNEYYRSKDRRIIQGHGQTDHLWRHLVCDAFRSCNWPDDELGTEFDLRARYMIFENLALDVVGAYLVAGDATAKDEDPYEIEPSLNLSSNLS